MRLLEVREGSEYSIAGKVKLLESKTEVAFIPDTGLREDSVYTLSLAGLSDVAGNLLPEVKSNFRTKKSSVLGFVEAKSVSDSLLVGNILVVASAEEGLRLFDVSDPTNMVPLSTLYLSRARGLSKEDLPSLELDPQGRVIVVGGGNPWNGYIKIVDITDPANPVQVGSQKITERVGRAASYYDVGLEPPPTTLPEAYLRRVQSLAGYAFVGTTGGGFEIIDGTKIEPQTSTKPDIILAIIQDSPTVMDLAAFQDEGAGSTYLVTTAFGIYKGLYLYNVTQPAEIVELSKYQTASSPQKLELALGYPYDVNNNGTVEEGEKRDLLFVSIPGEEKIKVLDITDRSFREVGEVKTPGPAGAMVVDAEAGVLYTHADEHLLLIDIRDIRRWEQPGYLFLDANADGVDDRIMSRVKTRAGLCQALSVDTNLKIAYVGNFDQGVELVRVDPPRVEIVQDTDEDGVYEVVEEVLPYGLEKNAQGNPVSSARNFVYLSAFFPGTKSSTITADLWSVNFEGELLPDWGQAETGLKAVVLTRQSDDPKSEKFSFFVSDKIQVTVDPESPYAGKKILSGDYLRAVLSPELSDVYTLEGKQYVTKEELWQGMDYVKSVRAELSLAKMRNEDKTRRKLLKINIQKMESEAG